MKVTGKILTIVMILVLNISSSTFLNGQECDTEALRVKSSSSLRGFAFMKAFPIEAADSDSKQEFSYVLSKDVSYCIVGAETENTNKLVVNLLDRNGKVIATNYIKQKKEFLPSIKFDCDATGVYYLEAYFKENKNSCGLLILAYKK
jgi:hypothetical protein